LGSNTGDSAATLRSAVRELGLILRDARASSPWRSKARYVEDQPDFINLAVTGLTDREPLELLDAIQGVEAAHGRDRSRERFKGPRSLDIDILLFGDRVIADERLVVPHPGLRERAFALAPLVELDPDLAHPADGVLLAHILALLPPQGIYPMESERL